MDRQRQDGNRYYRSSPLYPRMNRNCNTCQDARAFRNSTGSALAGSGTAAARSGQDRSCGQSDGCLTYTSLAMVYVPSQRFEQIYAPEKALQRGTAFQALDLPFGRGKRCHS